MKKITKRRTPMAADDTKIPPENDPNRREFGDGAFWSALLSREKVKAFSWQRKEKSI
jgi:hypothetical protein